MFVIQFEAHQRLALTYFSTIIKLYFVSFVQFSCVCLDVVLFRL